MAIFELDDERNLDVLIEEFLYLAGYADAEQWIQAYEGGCLRESTLYKLCTYYDNMYGTKYSDDVEKFLGRKMNPKGGWAD